MVSSELKRVPVDRIAEFPTELGNRCYLLKTIKLHPYCDSEEVLAEALEESARDPDVFRNVCLSYSPCRKFYDEYQKGNTPFFNLDPIRLEKYGEKYWAIEGKHRVCVAKRAGVKEIDAYVYELSENFHELLDQDGSSGTFAFESITYLRYGRVPRFAGAIGILMVDVPNRLRSEYPESHLLNHFFLDETRNTDGQWKQVLPGIRFRVMVEIKRPWFLIFGSKRIVVRSEIVIDPDHEKTKVWLARYSFEERRLKTLYRFGRWRNIHFEKLLKAMRGVFWKDIIRNVD